MQRRLRRGSKVCATDATGASDAAEVDGRLGRWVRRLEAPRGRSAKRTCIAHWDPEVGMCAAPPAHAEPSAHAHRSHPS